MLRFLSKRTGLQRAILWVFITILVIGLAVVIIAPGETREFFASYGPAPSASTVVARVGKYDISLRDLRQGISALGRNQQGGRNAPRQPDIDPEALYPSYGRQALDSLVNTRVVRLEAERYGLGVSDDELRERILSVFSPNGRWIGAEPYARYLRDNGTSVEQFESDMADLIIQEKLRDLLTSGLSVSEQEIADDYRRANTNMNPTWVLVEPKQGAPATPATDAELKAYFDAHTADFKITKDQRKVAYLYVNQDAVGETLQISDDELKPEYNENDYVTAVHAAQIVFNVPDAKQDAVVREKAQKAADAVRGTADKPGQDFATVAREQSEDAASKANGGDVGWLEKASLKPDDQRMRLFTMKPNDTTAPMKVNNAYVVFKVLERRAQTFEEARADVLKIVRGRRGYDEAVKIAQEAEDKLKESKDPQAVANQLNAARNAPADKPVVVVKETPFFQPGDTIPDIGKSPAFDDVTSKLENAKDVGSKISVQNGLAVPMLVEKRAPHDATFDEVRDKVVAAYAKEKSRNDARAAAEQLAMATSPDDLKAKAQAAGYEAKSQENFRAGGALGQMQASDLIDSTLLTLKTGEVGRTPLEMPTGFVVLAQGARTEAEMGEAFNSQHDSIRDRLLASKKSMLYETFMQSRLKELKDEKTVEIYQDVIDRAFAFGTYDDSEDEDSGVPSLPPVGAPKSTAPGRPPGLPPGGAPALPPAAPGQ
jgi:peptidyl-prolyl cis-trans isomerase D